MKVGARLVAALAIIAASLGGVAPAGAEGDLGPLEQCLAAKRSMAALFLIDTSGSLQHTDPANQRVGAIQAALRSLGTLAASNASSTDSLHLYVDFLEFGSVTKRAFPSLQRWAPVTGDTSPLERLAEDFSSRNDAEDTDYVAALQPWRNPADPSRPSDELGAIELLGSAPPGACRVLVWFTDGQLDIDYQGRPKELHWDDEPIPVHSEADQAPALDRARAVLCRPDGLIDTLRSPSRDVSKDGAFIAAVAFGDQDFDLMRSMALGTGREGPCGKRPASGAFLAAADVPELVERLREALLGKADAANGAIRTCFAPSSDCSQVGAVQAFDFPFRLQEGLTAFNLLSVAGDPQVQAALITPSGQEYPLKGSSAGRLDNGVVITIKQVVETVQQVSATLPGDRQDWAGQWRIRYRASDPAVAERMKNRASIYVFGSLEAHLRPGPPLRKGRTGTLIVELVSAAGQPASQGAYGPGSELVVKAGSTTLATPPVSPDGSFQFSLDIPADAPTAALPITALLRPVVRLSENVPPVELPTWEGQLGSVEVRPRPGYPLVDPPGPLGTLRKATSSRSTDVGLDATGNEAGGCISLIRLGFSALPPGMAGEPAARLSDGDRTLSPGQPCPVSLASGERRPLRLQLELSPEQLRVKEGMIRGSLVVRSTSSIDPAQTEDFTYEFGTKVEPTILRSENHALLWALLLLGLILPVSLLYLYNQLWAARLRLRPALSAEIDVALHGEADQKLFRREGETGQLTEFFLSEQDLKATQLENCKRRAVPVLGVEFAARAPRSPFGEPYASAAQPGAHLVVSGQGSTRRTRHGRLDLGIPRAWALRITEEELRRHKSAAQKDGEATTAVQGRLLLLLPPPGDWAIKTASAVRDEVERKAPAAIAAALADIKLPSPPPLTPDPETKDPWRGPGNAVPGGRDDDLPGGPAVTSPVADSVDESRRRRPSRGSSRQGTQSATPPGSQDWDDDLPR